MIRRGLTFLNIKTTRWQKIIYSALLLYLLFFLGAKFFAKYLIFIPHRASYQDSPLLIKLTHPSGEKIIVYHLKNPAAKHVILFSHGNGVDLGDLFPFFHQLRQHNFEVISYDYRGYGLSDGKSSEQNCYADLNLVYQYLTQDLQIKPNRIIVYGHSLGSGPSTELAINAPVRALILQGAFQSTFLVATKIKLLPFDQFENYRKISQLKVPLLIIHGTKDAIIPYSHGRKLFQLAPEPKQMLTIPNGNHNNLYQTQPHQFWPGLINFTQKLLSSSDSEH